MSEKLPLPWHIIEHNHTEVTSHHITGPSHTQVEGIIQGVSHLASSWNPAYVGHSAFSVHTELLVLLIQHPLDCKVISVLYVSPKFLYSLL